MTYQGHLRLNAQRPFRRPESGNRSRARSEPQLSEMLYDVELRCVARQRLAHRHNPAGLEVAEERRRRLKIGNLRWIEADDARARGVDSDEVGSHREHSK